MKTVEISSFGLDGLKTVERNQPTPGPYEVVMRVNAASLNYHDLVTVLGKANPKMDLPRVPLSDGAGEIVSVGSAVTRVQVGDRVMSTFYPDWTSGRVNRDVMRAVTGETVDGCLSEFAVLPAHGVVKTPADLSDAEASTLPCAALTAWRSVVVEAKIKAGDTVLLQGTGGVSIFGLQFCKLLGARVIITSSSNEKLERARELGADETINYRETPEWARAAKKLTGGVGVDHVMEVGGSGTFEQSLRALRLEGHIGMIGVLSGWADTVTTARIMALNATVKGITVACHDDFEAMCRAIELHNLRPVISDTFGFDEHVKAFGHMQGAGHFGKICLRF